MTDKQEIITKINQLLIEAFELEPEAIKPEADLQEDLGLDSLDYIDLVVALEKAFKIKIDEMEARQIDKVEKIYIQVLAKLKDA